MTTLVERSRIALNDKIAVLQSACETAADAGLFSVQVLNNDPDYEFLRRASRFLDSTVSVSPNADGFMLSW